MLTGRVPFQGSTSAVIGSHLYKEPPRPSEFRPDLPPGIEAAVLKMLAKQPGERFESGKAKDTFRTYCCSLQDILGWRAPAHASPQEIAEFERRYQLGASALAVLIGIGVCWAFGIGILQWLKIGVSNLLTKRTRVLDYIFTGFLIGGGTRAVNALLKTWGLLPSLPLERKTTSQPRDASATATPADVIARLVEVDALPGLFWKTLEVPPAHVGVLYSGDVGAQVLPAGRHNVRAIGARKPTLAALIDTTEFTLTPISPRVQTTDGESLDWT